MLLFLFPVRTDAPIYHFPYATVGLIATTIVTFIVTQVMPNMFGIGDADDYQDLLCATLGGAIQPLAWLTASFYHFDFGHIFFNVFQLWTFGLIVEGKLGWKKFLALFSCFGILGYAVTQILFYGVEVAFWGGGLSIVNAALMTMSFLWAPKNTVGLAYFFWVLFYIRIGIWDVAVSGFTMLFLALQIGMNLLSGTVFTSETMHLLGIALGGLVGTVMLHKKWVDCERWDLLSVMRGENGRQLKQAIYDKVDPSLGPSATRKKRVKAKKAKAVKDREANKKRDSKPLSPEKRSREKRKSDRSGSVPQAISPSDQTARKIHAFLKKKKCRAALQHLNERRRVDPEFSISPQDLLRLAQQLHDLERVDESVQFLGEYLDKHSGGSDRVRLTAAKIMIDDQTRPAAALRVLSPIDSSQLDDSERAQFAALLKKANAQIAEGVIELGDGAW